MPFVGARCFLLVRDGFCWCAMVFVGARCFLCVRHAFCWLARGDFVVLCAVVFCAIWFLSRAVFFCWCAMVFVGAGVFLLLRGVSSQ